MKKIKILIFLLFAIIGTSSASPLPLWHDNNKEGARHAPIHKWHPTISIGYTSIAIGSLPNNATITLTLFDEYGLTIYNRCVTASSKFTFEIPFEVLEDAEKIMVTINGQTFFV